MEQPGHHGLVTEPTMPPVVSIAKGKELLECGRDLDNRPRPLLGNLTAGDDGNITTIPHDEETLIHQQDLIPYPEIIVDAIKSARENVSHQDEMHIKSGLLPSLSRAYICLNDTLYLWNYSSHFHAPVLSYHGLEENILFVWAAPVIPGAFQPSITHILVLVYTSHVVILTIQPSAGLDGSDDVVSSLMSNPANFESDPIIDGEDDIVKGITLSWANLITAYDDTVTITQIIGTETGRVIMGTDSGDLLEIIYHDKTGYQHNLYNPSYLLQSDTVVERGPGRFSSLANNSPISTGIGITKKRSTSVLSFLKETISTITSGSGKSSSSSSSSRSTINLITLTEQSYVWSLVNPLFTTPIPIKQLTLDETRQYPLLYALLDDESVVVYSLGDQPQLRALVTSPSPSHLSRQQFRHSSLFDYYNDLASSYVKGNAKPSCKQLVALPKSDIFKQAQRCLTTLLSANTINLDQTDQQSFSQWLSSWFGASLPPPGQQPGNDPQKQAEYQRYQRGQALNKQLTVHMDASKHSIVSIHPLAADCSNHYYLYAVLSSSHRIYFSLYTKVEVPRMIQPPQLQHQHQQTPLLTRQQQHEQNTTNSLALTTSATSSGASDPLPESFEMTVGYVRLTAVIDQNPDRSSTNPESTHVSTLLQNSPNPDLQIDDVYYAAHIGSTDVIMCTDEMDPSSTRRRKGTILACFLASAPPVPAEVQARNTLLPPGATQPVTTTAGRFTATGNPKTMRKLYERVEYIFVPADVIDIASIPTSPLTTGTGGICVFTTKGVLSLKKLRVVDQLIPAIASAYHKQSTKMLKTLIYQHGVLEIITLLVMILSNAIPHTTTEGFASQQQFYHALLHHLSSSLTISYDVGVVRNVFYYAFEEERSRRSRYQQLQQQQFQLHQYQQQQQQQQQQSTQPSSYSGPYAAADSYPTGDDAISQQQQHQQQQQQSLVNTYPMGVSVSIPTASSRVQAFAVAASRLLSPVWNHPMLVFIHRQHQGLPPIHAAIPPHLVRQVLGIGTKRVKAAQEAPRAQQHPPQTSSWSSFFSGVSTSAFDEITRSDEEILISEMIPRCTFLLSQLNEIRDPLIRLTQLIDSEFANILSLPPSLVSPLNIPVLGPANTKPDVVMRPQQSGKSLSSGTQQKLTKYNALNDQQQYPRQDANTTITQNTTSSTMASNPENSTHVPTTSSKPTVRPHNDDISDLIAKQSAVDRARLLSLRNLLYCATHGITLFIGILRLIISLSPSAIIPSSITLSDSEHLSRLYQRGCEKVLLLFNSNLLYALSTVSFSMLVTTISGHTTLRALANTLSLIAQVYNVKISTSTGLNEGFGNPLTLNKLIDAPIVDEQTTVNASSLLDVSTLSTTGGGPQSEAGMRSPASKSGTSDASSSDTPHAPGRKAVALFYERITSTILDCLPSTDYIDFEDILFAECGFFFSSADYIASKATRYLMVFLQPHIASTRQITSRIGQNTGSKKGVSTLIVTVPSAERSINPATSTASLLSPFALAEYNNIPGITKTIFIRNRRQTQKQGNEAKEPSVSLNVLQNLLTAPVHTIATTPKATTSAIITLYSALNYAPQTNISHLTNMLLSSGLVEACYDLLIERGNILHQALPLTVDAKTKLSLLLSHSDQTSAGIVDNDSISPTSFITQGEWNISHYRDLIHSIQKLLFILAPPPSGTNNGREKSITAKGGFNMFSANTEASKASATAPGTSRPATPEEEELSTILHAADLHYGDTSVIKLVNARLWCEFTSQERDALLQNILPKLSSIQSPVILWGITQAIIKLQRPEMLRYVHHPIVEQILINEGYLSTLKEYYLIHHQYDHLTRTLMKLAVYSFPDDEEQPQQQSAYGEMPYREPGILDMTVMEQQQGLPLTLSSDAPTTELDALHFDLHDDRSRRPIYTPPNTVIAMSLGLTDKKRIPLTQRLEFMNQALHYAKQASTAAAPSGGSGLSGAAAFPHQTPSRGGALRRATLGQKSQQQPPSHSKQTTSDYINEITPRITLGDFQLHCIRYLQDQIKEDEYLTEQITSGVGDMQGKHNVSIILNNSNTKHQQTSFDQSILNEDNLEQFLNQSQVTMSKRKKHLLLDFKNSVLRTLPTLPATHKIYHQCIELIEEKLLSLQALLEICIHAKAYPLVLELLVIGLTTNSSDPHLALPQLYPALGMSQPERDSNSTLHVSDDDDDGSLTHRPHPQQQQQQHVPLQTFLIQLWSTTVRHLFVRSLLHSLFHWDVVLSHFIIDLLALLKRHPVVCDLNPIASLIEGLRYDYSLRTESRYGYVIYTLLGVRSTQNGFVNGQLPEGVLIPPTWQTVTAVSSSTASVGQPATTRSAAATPTSSTTTTLYSKFYAPYSPTFQKISGIHLIPTYKQLMVLLSTGLHRHGATYDESVSKGEVEITHFEILCILSLTELLYYIVHEISDNVYSRHQLRTVCATCVETIQITPIQLLSSLKPTRIINHIIPRIHWCFDQLHIISGDF